MAKVRKQSYATCTHLRSAVIKKNNTLENAIILSKYVLKFEPHQVF